MMKRSAARIFDRSRVPIYVQVASVMRQRIESGVWGMGEKISTLEELEDEFRVARVTIRQGIEMLREEGLLQSRQGRGTFVSGKPKHDRWLNVATDFETMLSSIRENVVRRAQVTKDSPPPDLGSGEGKLAEAYVFIRSVQYNKAEPFSVVNVHLDRQVYDRSPDRFLNAAAIAMISELDDVTITHAHQTLTIGVADPETAELLKIGLGEPTADCRLILLDQHDTAIYVADIHYHKSCFALKMDLLKRSGPRVSRPLTTRRKIA
jgi:GntR family transcriptional regulator